jgi:hypothetical protein
MTAARAGRHLAEPLANGSALRPEFRPYRWREPSSPYRARTAAAIRAKVGDEEDAWDSRPPLVSRHVNPKYLQPCGTEAAYRRHKRYGEEPCGICFDAHNAYKKPKGSTRKRPADIAERLELLASLRVHTGNGRGLTPGEVTTAQAAERLGVDARTVGRYLQRLRGAA